MKKWGFALLLAISMLLALCISANAADVSSEAELITAIANGTDVKMTQKITLTQPLTVEKNMTLDLNDRILQYAGTGSIITVKSGAVLTIKDSGARYEDGVLTMYGTGNIIGSDAAASENGGGLYIDKGGTVVLQCGYLKNCKARDKGGAAYVADGGKLCLVDGVIVGGEASTGGGVYVANGGTVEMTSHSEIRSCKSNGNGGGMYIEFGGIATMSGGMITDCTVNGSGGEVGGGGVYVASPTSSLVPDLLNGYGFQMSGGSIENCKAKNETGYGRAFGGGVYIDGNASGVFKMTGGSIDSCSAVGADWAFGGGVYLNGYDGKFTLTDGTITNCTARGTNNSSDAYGGGVGVGGSGVFEMTGGSIADNCTSYSGEGVDNGGVCIGCGGGSGVMRANGGTVYCAVENHNQIACTNPGNPTVFYGAVKNDEMHASISGGTFHGYVDNGQGSIDGGVFYGTVDNGGDGTSYGPGGYITGGVFDGRVIRSRYISGGTFEKKPQYAGYVTFETRGGKPVPEMQVRLNAPATEPDPAPTKGNQAFLGWYTDSECTQHYTFSDKNYNERIKEDITLYALWENDRCTVTFDSNGGSEVKNQMGLFNGYTAEEPVDPTKSGATFLGWFTEDGKHWNFTHDLVSGNITLTARWSDGGTPTPPSTVAVTGVTLDKTSLTLAKGGSETLTASVTPETATNKTVYWSSTDASVAAVSNGAVTAVKAGMALIIARTADGNYIATCTVTVTEDTPVETCTVSFDANDGFGSMADVSVQKGSSYQLPACGFTAPESMEFDAWQIGSARYGVGALYPVNANTTIMALWRSSAVTPGTCTVSFDANGGTGTMASVRMQTGSSFPLPICGFTAPAGKQFAGWARSADGAAITGGTIDVTADTTLYAIWEEIPAAEFVILFDANGGTATFGSLTTVGQRLPSLPGAVRGGYRFDGWYTAKAGGSRVTTDTVFSVNATVYAHWTYLSSGGGGNGGSTVTPPVTEDTPKQDSSFDDVPSGSYYEDAVSWAVENSITDGIDPAHFSPDSVCTRAQAVTFLYRAAGSPAPASQTMPFADVPAGSYYARAVLWAVETGITKGTSETAFSPDAPCTRAQIVSFLYRMIQSEGGGFTGLWMFRLPFTDTPDWAYEAIAWCYQKGITAGTTATTFSPDAGCTRAQIVTFLWRCKN